MTRHRPELVAARRERMLAQAAVIKAARQAQRLSQRGMAQVLGVEIQTLQSWEQGRRSIPMKAAQRYLSDFGCDPASLVSSEDRCPTCDRPL